MLVNNVKKLIEEMGNNGKIFSVNFVKKDGSLRTMQCRLTKFTTIGKSGGRLKYDPENFGLVTVYDVVKRDYRTVNTNTVTRLAGNGLVHEFKE